MGVLFILIYLGIVLAVIEINSLLFSYTGLDKHVARFQVISMLTGTGFTTGESELIIDHPIRRRLGAFLILFGAFSLAVIISAISNLLSDEFYTTKISIAAVVLIIIIFMLKMPQIKSFLSEKLEHELEEHFDFRDLPIRDALLTDESDQILDYFIDESCQFIGKELRNIIEEDADILVLYIQRGDLKIRKDRLVTVIQEGDHIIIYGDENAIEEKFGPIEYQQK
ncbi:TrkA C-terminal domain-containing protein [Cytobacillus sp. NCCP-133]|uniref:TrkA C-terminal domain-containing protein n=1 Tax=Cytobacillus sp. NCCP-133 TaxID=766848 RepID=UPI00222E2B5E|nr:TrkA C-terminal domain-containing protein [Cytobacillus sp. NCCP-133]GLB59980.1 potassium transporter TrkA [Cytobacillus sp. NCCP-133]